jgi:sporulation protein YlmC with PRC-barrel domain
VTVDEGVNLGTVAHIFLDPETKKLSALVFKDRKSGEEHFVGNDDITLVGQDVILIRDASKARQVEGSQDLGWRLRKLRGMMVTTTDGRNLGRLEDFNISLGTRVLSHLHLTEGRMLTVEPADVTIGPDAVVVPADYIGRVEAAPEKKGFFARVRGWADRGGRKNAEERR